jgi:propionyl-CoA synthetase
VGPVACFKICHIVEKLPKTRTGKYLRRIVRNMYNKEEYQIPSTVEDIDTVKYLHQFIEAVHLGKNNQ